MDIVLPDGRIIGDGDQRCKCACDLHDHLAQRVCDIIAATVAEFVFPDDVVPGAGGKMSIPMCRPCVQIWAQVVAEQLVAERQARR